MEHIADLPIVPCYKDKNCDSTFNCGDLCDPNTSQVCPQDPNYFQDPCWGRDPNSCQGILPFCDPEDPTSVRCTTQNDNHTIDGALNSNGQYMGCNIRSQQETYPPGYENNDIAQCVEYKNTNDKIADCTTSCWSDGGYDYIKNFCENQIGSNEFECKALEYFCHWDPNQNLCTLPFLRKTTTPLENYTQKYNHPPPPIQSLPVRRDCQGIGEDCIEINNPNYPNNLYVTSSQSLWDSTQQTTYDTNSRINCVHNTTTNTKKCIATPRCQFVENTCDCGSIENTSGDLQFMCSKKIFANTSSSGSEQIVRQGVGYCTWCEGRQTDKQYTIPESRSRELAIQGIESETTQWDDNCEGNRCNGYNECEVSESEELWNRCVYDESQGRYGLDYTAPNYDPNQLRTHGFCYDQQDPNMRQILEICEDKLENLGSLNKARTFSPNGEIPSCNYKYNWYHDCIRTDTDQISQNYLCTWCPSLQCKSGRMEEICREHVTNDPNLGSGVYCTADDCNCYLDILRNRGGLSNLVGDNVYAIIGGGMGIIIVIVSLLLIIFF